MELTERQRQAALDHTRSKCVTAGAGTGKTHVLVQKYISLLETGVGVGNILALTFTEKAAGEMKVRVRQALAEKEGERWDAVRDEFLWAKVSTFHSFCASVLREFPLEAGVGPAFAVLDEREAILLREEAADALIHGDPPAECREAVICALRAVGDYELKNYLEALYSRREASEAFFAALAESEEGVLDAWRTAVERRRAEALAAFLERAGDSIETLRDLAARYPGERDPGESYLRAVEPCLAGRIAVAALVEVHKDRRFRANMGQKKNWAGDDLERLRAAYRVLNDCIKAHAWALSLDVDPADPFTRATLDFLRDLGTVFGAFTGALEAEKRRKNALDFDDLIDRTHRLFSAHEDIVAAHFRDRFRFVLVDEFQDTDPVQIAILCAILGDLTRESAKLFVVGDPKQSIYLFREADVTQFGRIRDLIERDLGGEAVPLDVNFRSTPGVVGFTNAVFGALMAEGSRPWEFLYEPLRANRDGDTGSVELLLCPKARDRAAGRRAEAELVARKIRAIVERGEKPVYQDGEVRPAGYGDVAVLLERRTNLAYYEWALGRYGVPYRVHAGLGFYERQEVYDLYNILRFLANDLDDVALYGLLRSPYFGFSDARLFSIARAGTSLWERLQATEDPASATLRGWLLLSRRLPPARLIRRIVDESGIFVVYGGMAGGEQAAANVEKLIAVAREADCSTLADLVGELGRCIDDAQREGDAHLDFAAADAVSIMTVHAAKGLEFPVVVVPDLGETPRAGGGTIMVEDGLLLGVSIPNPANDHEREGTPVLTILRDEHRQKEEAERKRLFYVAATRAKDHLVLCGETPAEVPETLHDGKTRMAWLAHCLGLSPEVYARGEAVLETLRIPLTLDSAAIPVDVQEAAPVYLPLPDDVPAVPVPASILPAGEKERVYSASELERYLRAPAGSRPPGFAAGEDPLTRGLVVHEVFRGRDPAAVLRRYGVDPGRAGEYRELYERFLASPLMQGVVRDHREVPFLARVNGFAFRGAIDRLVQRPDGAWVLIDYKTGTPGGAGDYALQMTVYRHAAARILGAPVVPYLYFVDGDRWVEVAVDEERVFADIERAVRGIEEGDF
ncbi:UvrD-helicase domain-containing protein [Methanoculleus oceani]|uniref:DNA 3'-5' helicase n=1 Tax=Methanoculleus oceani TaxID=2184756 RepID=A0ABD4TBC9_9EURY|nr:UvrD-helicase domain-containing protein [Methanoculleus sp. CWC-02]MCM2465971.1 DNA helicase UvrD [Methanoculleus sp. CWC-02]